MVHFLLAALLLGVFSIVAARVTVLAWRPIIRPALCVAVVLGGVGLVAWVLTH